MATTVTPSPVVKVHVVTGTNPSISVSGLNSAEATVTSPSAVKVQVGTGTNPTATSVTYGAARTLKSATDLDMLDAENNEVIVYKSATNSFVIQSIIDSNLNIDNGFF